MKQKKRKKRPKAPRGKRTEWLYRCIDGNWTYYPAAYCKYHQGVLTEGLLQTHRCRQRQCKRLDEGTEFE